MLCNTNVTIFQFFKWIDQFVGTETERSAMEEVEPKIKSLKKLDDCVTSFDLCDPGDYFARSKN